MQQQQQSPFGGRPNPTPPNGNANNGTPPPPNPYQNNNNNRPPQGPPPPFAQQQQPGGRPNMNMNMNMNRPPPPMGMGPPGRPMGGPPPPGAMRPPPPGTPPNNMNMNMMSRPPPNANVMNRPPPMNMAGRPVPPPNQPGYFPGPGNVGQGPIPPQQQQFPPNNNNNNNFRPNRPPINPINNNNNNPSSSSSPFYQSQQQLQQQPLTQSRENLAFDSIEGGGQRSSVSQPPQQPIPPSNLGMANNVPVPGPGPLASPPADNMGGGKRRVYPNEAASVYGTSGGGNSFAAGANTGIAPPGMMSTGPYNNVPPSQQQQQLPQDFNNNANNAINAANNNNPTINTLQSQFQQMNFSPQTGSPMIPLIGTPPYVLDLKRDCDPPLVPSLNGGPPPPNCPVSFQRCTLGVIPQTPALLAKSRLLFGILCSPFHIAKKSDPPIPLIESGVIVRCRRCRTYINPFVAFIDGGSRWRCNICDLSNDIPSQFDYDSIKQQYFDRSLKPELNSAVVEFIAPSEYMVRPPQPPVYLFVIDTTFPAIQSGMVAVAAKAIMESLDKIPNGQDRTLVGFITFDSALHFYNLNEKLLDPQMLIVSELDDIFLPRPMDLLVNLTESRPVIESLLQKLSTLHSQTHATNSAFGSALKFAQHLMSPIGGKIISFVSSLPSVGEGALKAKEELKLLGTPKESSLLQPSIPFYKNFAVECSRSQICLDLFVFTSQCVDLATLTGAVRYTGGNLFYYPKFNSNILEDAIQFERDLIAFLSRPIGLEAVLRIRASKGITLSGYHGNFFLRSSDLLSLPNVSPDNSYAVQCSIDENLTGPNVCFQTALLHTSSDGERRIRVITSVVPISSSISEIYDKIDQGAFVTLLAKLAIERSFSKIEDARDALINKCIDVLGVYKSSGSGGMNTSVGGQLSICEPMKQLPLLILSLLKHPSLRVGSNILSDYRIYTGFSLRNMYVKETLTYLHPDFYALHNLPDDCGFPSADGSSIVLPPLLNLSSERLERHGLYLLDDGMEMLIWVGRAILPDLCINFFDRPSYETIPTGKVTLPILDNPYSKRIHSIIGYINSQGTYTRPVYVLKEDADPVMRMRFLWSLIEDRVDNSMSYPQWLAHLRDKVNAFTG